MPHCRLAQPTPSALEAAGDAPGYRKPNVENRRARARGIGRRARVRIANHRFQNGRIAAKTDSPQRKEDLGGLNYANQAGGFYFVFAPLCCREGFRFEWIQVLAERAPQFGQCS